MLLWWTSWYCVCGITGRRSKRSDRQRHTNGGCRNGRIRKLSWKELGNHQVCENVLYVLLEHPIQKVQMVIWVGLRVTRMRNRRVICTCIANLLLCELVLFYRKVYNNTVICCCGRNAFLTVYFSSRIYHQPLTLLVGWVWQSLLLGWVHLVTEPSLFFILSHTKRPAFLYHASYIYFLQTMQKQSMA